MKTRALRCVNCGREYSLGLEYRCGNCDFPLEVVYAPPAPAEALDLPGLPGIWRYRLQLPVTDQECEVSLGEGNTPLICARRLGAELGLPNLFIKNEGQNPTGSFKDRPTSVGVSVARALSVKTVVVSSTGNAGASLAAYAAQAGLQALVFVTDGTPAAKLAQMVMHGARIVTVKGSLSDAFWLAYRAARKWSWMDLTSTFLCPYTVEGDKTVAYEMYTQLGGVPDYVLVPVSVGPLLVGIYKGFVELKQRGLVHNLPRMVAVQAERCAPIARAFTDGEAEVRPWEDAMSTVAGGIADPLRGYERDGTYALRVVRESGGLALACSDQEILAATRDLARAEGIFGEPTGAVSVAGLRQLASMPGFSPEQTVVSVVTGHGLKQVRLFEEGMQLPPAIEPTLDALASTLDHA